MRFLAPVLAVMVLGFLLVPASFADDSAKPTPVANNSTAAGSGSFVRSAVKLIADVPVPNPPAMTSDELPKFDVFGGYSYVRVSFKTGGAGGNTTSNLNGASGAVGVYLNKWLGIVGDFGGYKVSTLKQGGNSLGVSGTIFTYLFGPRIRFGSGGVTPFVQALFGGAHNGDITCPTSNATCTAFTSGTGLVLKSDNAFAMTIGGGVDVKVATHFAIRGQAEYLMTRFKETGGATPKTGTQNNARISVGVVIH